MTCEPESGEEREFKLGIPDAAALHALIQRAGGRVGAPVEQENHFFDSATGGLRERGIGLRIRDEGGHFTLTLKGPTSTGADAALMVRAELELELDPRRARAVLGGALPVTALLDGLDAAARRSGRTALVEAVWTVAAESPLRCIGTFRNTRTPVETELEVEGVRRPVLLEFDRTCFAPDDVRLEVEMEIAADAPVGLLAGALADLFRAAGVEPVATIGKLAHFQQRLDQKRLDQDRARSR